MARKRDTEAAANTETDVLAKEKRHHAFLLFSAAFFFLSVVVLAVGYLNTAFAEGYANTVSAFLRGLLAVITAPLPFSLTEFLVLLAPAAVLLFLIRAVVLRFYYGKRGRIRLFFRRALGVVLVLAAVFINTFGICYQRRDAWSLFDLDVAAVSERDVLVSAALVLDAAQRTCDSLIYTAEGATRMPYGFAGLCAAVRDGYSKLLVTLPPVLSLKPVTLSEPWTYTHISGMYMPLTGESNINVNYPDYVSSYTTAHETAHQLGIASEDEANFFAFLACLASGDEYLLYAGCLNAFEYLLADLEPQSVEDLLSVMDERIAGELRAYNAFFEKYRSSKAAVYASAANDAYLRAQGVSAGVKSYSDVTKLICAYLKKHLPEYYR